MEVTATVQGTKAPPKDPALLSLANKLEAQFLAEMLKASGISKPPEGFGGGAGEDQFSSFLTQEYAAATVNAGGIGLSEAIYDALIKKDQTQ
jgi:Rod binding domain-containing protein